MNVLSFIQSVFEPAVRLIDDIHTSDEERLQLVNQLKALENAVSLKVVQYEAKLLESQASILITEANGQSWLQRSWRPVTMLTFLVLVVCDSFGWLANPLAPEAWTLLQIGLGGYVTGRSAEKMLQTYKAK